MPIVSPNSKKKVDVTVFIPTFNGEKYLSALLNSLENQDFPGDFEILVIDSGSTDATISIIEEFKKVKIVQIPQEDFGHGKTRNLGAKLARGTYVVFLTQDAIPSDKNWLSEIIQPLSSNVAEAVFGKQIARENAFPSMKYDISDTFTQCGQDGNLHIIQGPINLNIFPEAVFYSDVNSATTRDFLVSKIPYRDVSYSEDFLFATDLLQAGYRKAYQPSAKVIHSNDVTYSEYLFRIFDETLSLRRNEISFSKPSMTRTVLRGFKNMLFSSIRILGDPDYPFRQKMKWLWGNNIYLFNKWRGIYLASNLDLNDVTRINKYSLEAHRSRQS